MIACLLNPASCIGDLATSAADAILSLFPFGAIGLAFTAGMIIGAIIGKWGVGALIALAIAVKLGSAVQVAHPDNPAQPTKRALTADEVRQLQTALNNLGHNAGPVDGKPGRQTREAIRQFQASRGDTATGIPTSLQLKALGVWR